MNDITTVTTTAEIDDSEYEQNGIPRDLFFLMQRRVPLSPCILHRKQQSCFTFARF